MGLKWFQFNNSPWLPADREKILYGKLIPHIGTSKIPQIKDNKIGAHNKKLQNLHMETTINKNQQKHKNIVDTQVL